MSVSSLRALIIEAEALLDCHQAEIETHGRPDHASAFDDLLRRLNATSDPNEASRLYDQLVNLPAETAPSGDPHPEFIAWCGTGALPTSIGGLEGLSSFLQLFYFRRNDH